MEKVLSVYKPQGMTPLEAVELLRRKKPELESVKLGYAGRLDPMAEGLLLVLVGRENLNRKAYERLPKVYEFEFVLGFSTDSYDLLGKVVSVKRIKNHESRIKIEHILDSLVGRQEQAYPPYSAVKIKSHPLFWWARNGRLSEVTIPSKEIEIYQINLLSKRTMSTFQLLKDIEEKISRVNGHFRQEEIMSHWKNVLSKNVDIPLYTLSISCSSGTYVRSIVQQIGKKLSIPTVTYSIQRTQVGSYTLAGALSLT